MIAELGVDVDAKRVIEADSAFVMGTYARQLMVYVSGDGA